MDSSFLATKLRIPPPKQQLVRRSRLIESLEHGILNYKLVLVSAPAGYGKTTLLSQWAHASRVSIAWYSVGEEDNDLEHFLRYLVRSWKEEQPAVSESPLDLLIGAMSLNRDAVLSAFINVANDIPDHMVFVLDDYHLIDEPSIHTALAFLLDHLPPTIHVVLAGRAEPPLPLARYRARHELMQIQAEELRFLREETEEFLNQMGLGLTHDHVLGLQAQLEGWIAGLQLVALTLQRHLTGADELVISGRHRFIADYLSQDVLARLPDEIRRFLLETSIVDRLCGSLCNAVTGRKDSQGMLELLERENLFLVPLDDQREWYRFHWLFADFLQEELRRRHPEEAAQLHRRAAGWYLAHDLPEQAFEHGVAGDDLELVIEIFDRYANVKLIGGEFKLVRRWLDSLPTAWYAAYPVFGLAQAGLLAFTGAFEACVRCVDDIERQLASLDNGETRPQMARVTAVRCFIACMQNDLARAGALADQALRDLPAEDLGFRPMIYGALGDSYRQHGRWEEAKECYHAVLTFSQAPFLYAQSAHVFGALADLDLRQGRLRTAADYWRKALAVIQERENWGRIALPLSGWVYVRTSELLYEWNELAAAGDHLARGLERAELGGDVRARIAGYLMAARMKLTEGDIEAAADSLDRARPLVEQAPFSEWISRFERCQLELWLAQDRLRAAVDWSDAMLTGDALKSRPESEITQVAMARVLIVKGDAPSRERALALLARLLQAAEAEGRVGVQVETLALQAIARWSAGDLAAAMISLERALTMAEPEGYVRLFADLGLPMARLLQEARSRHVMPAYVAKLLEASGAALAFPASGTRALPEPLSQREQEVLRLITAGLTNREIADALFISPETVKKHTGSIYGKLDVSHRTEAAARARTLGLLG